MTEDARTKHDTAENLRMELVRVQIENLKISQEQIRQQLETRIEQNSSELLDHESRLRLVEDTSTKFNFLVYLTMGGGLVGLINLGLLAFTLLRAVNP